jgi:hypothetical protein
MYGGFGDLTRGNPYDMHGVADHVGGRFCGPLGMI